MRISDNNIIVKIAHKIGMDGAIAYSSGARIIQGIAGVGSMFFISTFLTGVEQGFYFTFGSILALQIFFELGLTGIMTQYVAHEASHLELTEDSSYKGDEKYLSRLASLFRFCVKWYSILAVTVFLFLIIVGFIYFSRYGDSQAEDVGWRLPWILVSLATSIQLFISPMTSILTGLGFVKETTKISFFQQIIMPLSIWIGLFLGAKLFVSGIAYLLSSLVWLLLANKMGLLRVLLSFSKVDITERVSYVKEIFPYQWKIALSWVSGYFIFQLFNPVLFASEGAIVAGQMGMTLTAINAMQGLSVSWMNTKIPFFSKLIALKDYAQLDKRFFTTLKQMIGVGLVCIVLFVSFIALLREGQIVLNGELLADRFLPYLPMAFLLLASLANQFIGAWATYLRCHKQEPLVVQSVVVGILVMTSTLICGKYVGVLGVTMGYSLITVFISLPWTYKIFITKKSEWHE